MRNTVKYLGKVLQSIFSLYSVLLEIIILKIFIKIIINLNMYSLKIINHKYICKQIFKFDISIKNNYLNWTENLNNEILIFGYFTFTNSQNLIWVNNKIPDLKMTKESRKVKIRGRSLLSADNRCWSYLEDSSIFLFSIIRGI